jgi:UDP-N-acetylglucosamine 2-epimerase (non-hydrolysing)
LSEGFRKDHIFVTGSPLREVLNKYSEKISQSNVLTEMSLMPGKYFVVSAHREENIDLKDHFNILANSLNSVAKKYQLPIIFSTHPRTKKRIEQEKIIFDPLIRNVPPLGFFDYVNLQKSAFCVLSDSGTISEESAMMDFPAVSIRTSTERPEAIDAGTIVLGDIHEDQVLNAIEIVKLTYGPQSSQLPVEYNISNTSDRVVRVISSYLPIVNKVIWNK